MLVIRERQLRSLNRSALPRWIAAHLRRFFPSECEELGEAGLREEIRYGLQRAASHGFTTEMHLSQYLDLMFTFGRDFDTDPALGWPAQILNDPEMRNPGLKMEKLLATGVQYLENEAETAPGEDAED